jgi:hypothetical protein
MWDQWALYLIAVVALCVVYLALYREATRPFSRRTKMGIILAVGGAVCFGISAAWLGLVVLPYERYLLAWDNAQFFHFMRQSLYQQSCSLDAQAALKTRLQAAASGWENVLVSLGVLGGVASWTGLLLLRLARQRSQVARGDA